MSIVGGRIGAIGTIVAAIGNTPPTIFLKFTLY